ncbi:MAG: hypothetical protein ACRCXT_11095, partial [Paraclostridium sp.]
MANNLEFAKVFQSALDQQMIEEATSGWMERNSNLVKYNGGDEVKIPKLAMQGLGDYDRANGYVAGDVTLEWETRKLTQDRGRSFQIDAMDVDETAFQATIPNIVGQFQRTKVAPEIDAYRYSRLATLATNKRDLDVTKENIYESLLEDIAAIQDVIGEVPLVITLNKKLSITLAMDKNISKMITVSDFTKGEVSTKVKKIDEHFIIEVPSARMKSAYTFASNGAGGFTPASGAKDINWIICPMSVPIAVSKTDKIRIFDPETNQNANAWKTDYRKYHDIWVTDNGQEGLYVNTKPAPTVFNTINEEVQEDAQANKYLDMTLEELKAIAK